MLKLIKSIVSYLPAVFAAVFALIQYVYIYVIRGEPISYPGGKKY
jgi:hypothetical protein